MLPIKSFKGVESVGIGDNTNINKVISLSKKNPFAKWSFLYDGKSHDGVHPSLFSMSNHIERLNHADIEIAIHLDGDGITRFLDFINDKDDKDFQEEFSFVMNNVNNVWINTLSKGTGYRQIFDASQVAQMCKWTSSNRKTFIASVDEEDSNLHNEVDLYTQMYGNIKYRKAHDWGKDDNWSKALKQKEFYPIFAGGFNKSNILQRAILISRNIRWKKASFDVSMEGSLQTDGHMDLNKVEELLNIARPHIDAIVAF